MISSINRLSKLGKKTTHNDIQYTFFYLLFRVVTFINATNYYIYKSVHDGGFIDLTAL